jgi:hypothetical protein
MALELDGVPALRRSYVTTANQLLSMDGQRD